MKTPISGILFYFQLIFFLFITGCGQGNDQVTVKDRLGLQLSADSSAVELIHVPPAISGELRQDSLAYEQWVNFFAVYRDTSDVEMRDFRDPVAGSYFIEDTVIRFIPARPFTKGGYFSRCYTRDILEEPEDILRKKDLSPTEGYIEFRFGIR